MTDPTPKEEISKDKMSDTAVIRMLRQNSLLPSNSTNATFLSGAIVTLIIYILSLKGINLPAGIEAAVTVVVSTLIGYIPESGRKK